MNEDITKTSTIVRLKTSNFLKIGAEGVEIVPNSNCITLTGKNASGKSSVLMSIFATLRGKTALPPMPIHQGASKSESFIDFGDFTAEMKITPKGTTIEVKSKGVTIRSPGDFLRSNSNEILLDLVRFMRLGETAEGRRSQRATLERLVGLDMSQLDAERKRIFDERTLINRELDQESKKLDAYPFDSTAPKEEVSVTDLMDQLQAKQKEVDEQVNKIREANAAVTEFGNNIKLAQERQNSLLEAIENEQGIIIKMQMDLDKRRAELDSKKTIAARQQSAIEFDTDKLSILEIQDIEGVEQAAALAKKPIQDAIKAADTDNTKFRNNKRRREIEEIVRGKKVLADSLTQKMFDIDVNKTQMLSRAKFPLPNLSFNEDGILLNGLPMEQGSMAQQLKAIAAIGFAFKPRIPVALIQDASLFDSESLQEITDMAEAAGGQVWCECVARLDEKGNAIAEPFCILIEDGSVVSK